MTLNRKKIAILGGGPSSLTAAFWLTSTDELRAKFDITVYQMGWRLGGKGASGRDRAKGDRIYEHGLHILFGFYQNFFHMMREVYDAADRPPHAPLATWREAFHPHSFGVVEDFNEGRWTPWNLVFPRNREVPGSGDALNGGLDYTSMFIQALIEAVLGWPTLERWERKNFPFGEKWEQDRDEGSNRPHRLTWAVAVLLQWALSIVHDVSRFTGKYLPVLSVIFGRIRSLVWRIIDRAARHSEKARAIWLGVDFIVAMMVGVIRDGVFEEGGCTRIDRYDFREWLERNGAHAATLHSPWPRMIYDAAFSYADGRSTEQSMSAGVAMRTMARMVFTYKGAMYYKMQAGMGDTVFGPMYQVLKRRGVKFAFFHKVRSVELAPDAQDVERVVVQRQVALKSGDPYGYEPLFDVKGLPCWPSKPLYEQIDDAEAIEGIDLESYYSGYEGVEELVLTKGRDFDTVIYGMPVQTIPFICPNIHQSDTRWKDMVKWVQAVQTLSFQLWFTKNLPEMGWEAPSPLLSVFVEPVNTWADMSQVLPRENWTGDQPRATTYFTGSQVGPEQPPPLEDHDFPVRMRAAVHTEMVEYCRKNLTTLLPETVDPERPPELDWTVLVDPENREGEARLQAQYWRSNCGPSERCTVALPGAQQYRIGAGDTGYPSLIFAGDWIDNGFYVACMEGAIMGGIHAARAVAGVEFPIIGEALDKRFS
jgi:uncharacterized protein with NAD-binding domain and iron-sulfur cluster